MKSRFLSAADSTRPLLDLPELDERWHTPSALSRMTIGELAAHLSRAVTVVPGYLGTEGEAPLRDAAGYFVANFPEADRDLDSDLAVGVRARARQEAADGPSEVRTAWDRAREELEIRLDESGTLAVRGATMSVEDYLVTRMVELVVHSDDLAASLEIEPPRFDSAVTDVVMDCLVRVAARRHGPATVIRAMSRSERADPSALVVF